MTQHVQALVSAFAPVMRSYVTQTMGAVLARVEELEGEIKGLKAELQAREFDPAAVIERAVAEHVGRIPVPRDGRDADPLEVAGLVSAEVERAVATLPAPRDGADADPAVIRAMVDEAVATIPAPQNGRDADPAVIEKMVAEAVAAL